MGRDLNCFHSILDFFGILEKCTFNYKASFLNVWKLLKLAMTYPAATATCVRTFSLGKLIRMDLRSTMADERMNYLCVLKYYSEFLMGIKIENIISEFAAEKTQHINNFKCKPNEN